MESALRTMAAHTTASPGADGGITASPAPMAPPAKRTPVFASDRVTEADPLGRAPTAALLAELALHADAQTPFAIGLLGPAGAGKSAFLDGMLGAAGRLAAAAGEAGLASTFVADVAVVRVDAAAGAEDPAGLLAGAVFDRLARSHPDLAAELRHAGGDPHAAAREASEALADARRKLDGERQALEALSGRAAQLGDTVLNTPGSTVDLYARAKRGALERILRRFGFQAADPVVTFKALVREAAEGGGTAPRLALVGRALYAYGGQARLLGGAVALVGLAWACAALRDTRETWLDAVRGLGEKTGPVADWLGAHVGWLGTLQTLALLGAVGLLLLDVIRAARFALPISRGADLLGQELDARRREMEALVGQQTRRVDGLAAAAEVAAAAAAEAERRAVRHGGGAPGALTRPAGLVPGEGAAAALLRAVSERATGTRPDGAGAPSRVIVAMDHLDALPDMAAAGLLATAGRLLGPGFVTVAAVDPAHLRSGFGDTDPARAADAMARLIQVPVRLRPQADDADAVGRATAAALLAGGDAAAAAEPDARRSRLDAPWRPGEADTVARVAPLAGDTPRAIKRFVNLYRLARADAALGEASGPVLAALALTLATEQGGWPSDLAALDTALRGGALPEAAGLRAAVEPLRGAPGGLPDAAGLRAAQAVAARYAGRL